MMEKGMEIHSSILAWRIPWTEKPGGLQSVGSLRVGYDWTTNTHNLPWSDGTGCHDFVFWTLSFKPAFSLSSFTFIKRPFNSSLLSAVRVVSFVYMRLLIFLLAILILACALSSPVCHMILNLGTAIRLCLKCSWLWLFHGHTFPMLFCHDYWVNMGDGFL